MEIGFLVIFVVISTSLVNGSCPSVCSCSSTTQGSDVNCNSRSLLHFPDLPINTYYIDLRYNSITEIDVQLCKDMPKLKHLFVNDNQISVVQVNAFEDCEIMDTIYLQYNKIRSIESFTFINMPKLIKLYIDNNEISTIEPYSFMNLPNLLNMDLSGNNMSHIDETMFRNLTSLSLLLFKNNKIQSLETNTFINMVHLSELNLSGNNISHIEEHAFGNLPSLAALHLTGNPLNCDCSIFSFWTWLIERASIGTSAICSNGTLVISLESAALETCNCK
ncbi:SLIT3 [Mytilus coruscus]|uniref:SLIT3 n=1 Tax=Mytilus coruscus TaxID=42192 RepID=A0A6J8EGV9_MYTCO|nr:SLIT3 [Mytilus coruscus]